MGCPAYPSPQQLVVVTQRLDAQPTAASEPTNRHEYVARRHGATLYPSRPVAARGCVDLVAQAEWQVHVELEEAAGEVVPPGLGAGEGIGARPHAGVVVERAGHDCAQVRKREGSDDAAGGIEQLRCVLRVWSHPWSVPATFMTMDRLRHDDIERARRTPPEVRAAQALEAMRVGIHLRRAALRARHPAETDAEIEARLRRWLARDE